MQPIGQPIPLKKKLASKGFSFSPRQSSPLAVNGFPNAHLNESCQKPDNQLTSSLVAADSYSQIELERASHYALNYPVNDAEAVLNSQTKGHVSYSTAFNEDPSLQGYLPYQLETLHDKAKYLSHIVSHLYIAVQSMDIQGAIAINAKEFDEMKHFLQNESLELTSDVDSSEQDLYKDVSSDDGSDADSDEEDTGTSTPVTKVAPMSAAIINARHWSIELRTLLQMDFPIPLQLRASLVKVYYAICLSQGQGPITEIFLDVFQRLLSQKEDLKEHGLVLDWTLAFDLCQKNFPHENAAFDSFDKRNFKKLLNVCFLANSFFSKTSVSQIMSRVLSKFSSSNGSLSVCCLYGLLPMNFEATDDDSQLKFSKSDVRHYIPSIFYIWSSAQRSENLDAHLVALLSRIAEHSFLEASKPGSSASASFGPFGVFTESQFSALFQNLFQSLNIGNLKQSKHSSTFYQSFANLVVFSIIGGADQDSSGTLKTLKIFFNSVRSFVHPSNTGPWSPSLSKLIQYIISQYQKRAQMEMNDKTNNMKTSLLVNLPDDLKLNDKLHKSFAEIFLPLIQTGIQGKKDNIVNQYISSLSLLCYLTPKYVLDAILVDCYISLEAVTSNHRLKAVLKELAAVVRYMVSLPVYRVHIFRILTAVLPGIDSNDLVKSIQTLHLIAATSSFIPFVDLSSGQVDSAADALDFTQQHIEFLEKRFYDADKVFGATLEEFIYDDAYERQAFVSSTVSLKEFLSVYCERIFLMLENLPDPQKSTGLESKIVAFVPKTFSVLVESLSPENFDYLADLMYQEVAEKVLYTVSDCVGCLVGSLIRRQPEKQFPRYLNLLEARIIEEIEENGAGGARGDGDVAPRDQGLFWYTILLSCAIAHAGEVVLEYAEQIKAIGSKLLKTAKGPVSMVTSLILYQTLQTTTTTKLTEARYAGKKMTELSPADLWGGYQFSPKRFTKEYLSFGWHIPSKEEVSFAISLFESSTNELMEDTEELITSSESDMVVISDKLGSNIIALGHCIAGIAHLFDPGYAEPSHDASRPMFLRKKLDSIALLKKGLSSAESLNKAPSAGRTPDFVNSPMKGVVQADSDDSNEGFVDVEQIQKEDFVDANAIDEDVIMDDTNSNVTDIPMSGKATPSTSFSGKDEISESLNAVLSFKNKKIYSSNYYFGSSKFEKDSSSEYLKLHELRDSVGKFLHKLFVYTSEKHSNNTKLHKMLLHTYKIWLCDVGNETVLNLNRPSALRFDYIDSFQYIRRVKKPYTRIGFGLMLENLHKERVNLFAGSRILTSVDKVLLSDVVDLSASAYPGISSSAVSTLYSSMKLLLGSYGIAIKRLISIIQTAMVNNDELKLKHSLAVLNSKRFRGRIGSDFANISAVVKILNECMNMETNPAIGNYAASIYSNIVNKVKLPSSICELESSYITSIKPPDAYVDLEVDAVKAAKKLKRERFAESLQQLSSYLLGSIAASSFWKVNYFNLALLINIQSDPEIEVNEEVLPKLVSLLFSSHPSVFRLCLKGLCGVLDKLKSLSIFRYNIRDFYLCDHDPNELLVISTKPNGATGGNFQLDFRHEMANFKKPQYFVDNKRNQNSLFWDDEIAVVDNTFHPELHLKEKERTIIEKFSALITSDRLSNLAKLLVQEAETDGGFHTNDVRLVTLLVHLMSAGMTPALKENDWFTLIENIYVPDDKDTHLVVCELMAGLLVSNSHTTAAFAVATDIFVAKLLNKILQKDINPENRGIWIVFSWWVPSNSDIRRHPEVSKVLLNFSLDKKSDSSFIDASRIMFLKHLVGTLSYRYPDLDNLIERCFDNIDHPYQAVREQMASLLTALFMVAPIDPSADCNTFVEHAKTDTALSVNVALDSRIRNLFQCLEDRKAELTGLSVNESLKTQYFYTSRSVIKLLRNLMMTSASSELVPYLDTQIMPFLLDIATYREVCALAGISPQQTFILLANIPFKKQQLQKIVDYVVAFDLKTTSWHNLQALGYFLQFFHQKQLLSLSEKQHEQIFEFVFKLLFHEQLEVREMASRIVTTIVHTWSGPEFHNKIGNTLQRIIKILNKGKRRFNKHEATEKTMIKLHGATLGLAAVINAFPYISPIPRWLPLVLTTLANKCSDVPGNTGKTAKSSLSKFKKDRQDTWHIDVKLFTAAELQDLEGALWTSYFV